MMRIVERGFPRLRMGRCLGRGIAATCMAWCLLSCGPPPPVPQLLPEEEVVELLEPLPVTPHLQAYVEADGFPEYLIGPGDLLTIALRDVEVVVEKVTVRPDGNISFSLAEDIQAAGSTATQLDSALTAALGRFLRRPKVDVEVTEYRSKMISVLGAVQTVVTSGTKTGQGRYPLRGKSTVLDIILEAGGTTPDAQLDRVQLLRHGKGYTLDLQRVLETGDPDHNPVVQGEDIIIVPGAAALTKKVIVLGEVQAPNVYLFAEDASLLEAVSRAGGLNANALRDDIRLIRGTEEGPQMFTVNFERITQFGDLQQNVGLKNNDIIYIPRSFMGDVNDVITKVEPLLDLLLLPSTYRDLYTTGGGLRIDTGEPPETGTNQVFTQPLPGFKPAVPAAEQEEKEKKKE
ncbi:MAG: polysaccharide export protein [Gemmatimonadetes bacterium]|nr:polysaccharide export protein [Gemmatimonadota bacterium]